MPIDLTGIGNENEYFTFHYLTVILENDLKGLYAQWAEQEKAAQEKPPYQRLSNLYRQYFNLRSRLERIKAPEERLNLQRELLPQLLEILGYPFSPQLQELDNGALLPLLGALEKTGGEPLLWILETVNPAGEESDPLELSLLETQYPGDASGELLTGIPLVELISKEIFTRTEPPRWLLILSFSQIVLLDRSKWNEKRFLRFDLPEILSRRESSTLKATAALLHRESVCPVEGISLLDTLDENSHKHAFEVSEDLKYAVREAVEILGNEAVFYLRNVLKDKVFEQALDAPQLTVECLRYFYRLLFLFYLEARPELEYIPMKSEEYRSGYSLESLRDLELVSLTSEESRSGYYLHHSLHKLFELVFNGFNHVPRMEELPLEDAPLYHTFRMVPLKSHLFDPDKTPLLNRVKFRNAPLQRVIELLSLSRPGNGRNQRRGRISYAQLGINQLGAVYEGLLSYSGFFAEADLYEVKKRGESPPSELDTAYFVKAQDLPDYDEDEKVFNPDGTLRMHPKGRFIYRLAGRNREKSASYYTPEVLTKCLVKYALKELLPEDLAADEILKLTVCEPAMGSGAFLNETVNQLAEAYLLRKQRELHRVLGPEEYNRARQKVKMFIADTNVFGVDLNPIAVELAEVSLWLNCIYGERDQELYRNTLFVPWFGMQLNTGNSLVGARRQVFHPDLFQRKIDWLNAAPERIKPGERRPGQTVYHFLLPDAGMVNYNNKVINQMAGENLAALKNWRKEFIKPFSDGQVKTLQRLSAAIDRLWEEHTRQQAKIRERTTDPIEIFGHKLKNNRPPGTTREKDKILHQELYSQNVRNSSPYRRLKLVMDYWCALWFWPIDKTDLLPSREEYLFDLMLLLEGNVLESGSVGETIPLFPETQPVEEARKLADELGFVNVDRLCRENKRLGLVQDLAQRQRFFHWELEYADLFARRGGFDLVLGNPPWIKLEWNEGGILGDYEPLFVIRKFSAARLNQLREETLQKYHIAGEYLSEFSESEGIQNFLNAKQNYPELLGMQSNLYKCFLPRAWYLSNARGASGFLHPEGVYDDPKGGMLREAVYQRLRSHFQFQNELNLFGDIDHHVKFSINIYSAENEDMVQIRHIANLFAVPTVDACFEYQGTAAVGGIKDEESKWNVNGHSDRIIPVDAAILELFARLYDPPGTPALQARLPVVHSRQVVEVLRKFAQQPRRLGDLKDEYISTVMWDETNAQKTGTIKRNTRFPNNLTEWIVSGPHFYVGNPFNKTPRAECRLNSDYDVLDLNELPEDYLPRSNYVPACAPAVYENRTPKVPWGDQKPVTEFYNLIHRRMLSQSGERTMVTSILPPESGHIHTVISTCFKDIEILLEASFIMSSVVFDFWVKTTGKSDFTSGNMEYVPLINSTNLNVSAINRLLMLNCLTTHYAELWQQCWQEDFRRERWSKNDPRLDNARFANLTPHWQRSCALRTDYERRQALLEIDVLAALALGLTLEELCAIYRIQFPVLRQNENDTWYDRHGRIVFTCSKGLPGVGFSRPEWNEIKDMAGGTVPRTITDDTLPSGPRERTITYVAPFDKCDREADYVTAWGVFEKRIERG